MLINNIFTGVFDSSLSINTSSFILCMISGVLLGLLVTLFYMYKTRYSKSFIVTLTTLPAAVAMIIMMVNGNVGAGVAVAGAFSLVRFRSVPGTAKEIGAIFIAMAAGIAIGMGYIAFAFLFVFLISGSNFILNSTSFGSIKESSRSLSITIPEDLNYTSVFNDLFDKYTNNLMLNEVKTTNMGSLFKLSYTFELKDVSLEKEFIDELRIRNGNLNITICKQVSLSTEL